MLTENNISFRKMELADLPLLHKWLNVPHVHEFYDKEKDNSFEEIRKRYAPKIQGRKSTDCFFCVV